MTVRYAVTFEFPTRPPLTLRGTVAGSGATTCGARATRLAQKALRPVAWSSVVCVLLERLDAASEPADDEPEAAAAVDPHVASPGTPAPARMNDL